MIKMAQKLAYRQGIGGFLADGVREASRKLGKGSDKFAIHMKGQDSADHYRIQKGWALGLSTSPVAGRHLRGAMGRPNKINPTEYKNQAEAVFWQARIQEIQDITGICVYMGPFSGVGALQLSDYVELVNSAMGIELTEEELMLIGKRSVNLEKAFNTLHAGFARQDDFPPRRYMEEPVKSGPYAGYKCDKEEWDKMLSEFYELHGWDKGTGLQTRQGLTELGGMEDITQKLERAGKLI